MDINIQLFSVLRDCLPSGSKDGKQILSWPDREVITLVDVVKELEIEKRFEIKAEDFILKTAWQILVNGLSVDKMDIPLKNGDLVQLFPPMSGG